MKNFMPLFALLALTGCESDSKDPNAGTYNLSGTVTGLTGDLTISINGSRELITSNGVFYTATRITDGDSYQISVSESTENLNCTISNDSGVSEQNVTNIDVECDGTGQVAYHLNSLAFNVEEPSIITFAFHLIDRETDLALTNLTTENIEDYLRLTENDDDISPSESFLEVEQSDNFNVEYHTAFAIDISASNTVEDLSTITSVIRNTLFDETSGTSKLSKNQFISIYTFDSKVEEVVSQSQDIDQILTTLEQISIGAPSTNLYGAIQAGVSNWTNEISLQQVSYGSLILFTDGKDTSSIVSKSQAQDSAAGKDIYFIAVGNETDVDTLQEFTSPNNIFSLSEYSQLEQAVNNAFTRMKTYEDGLYVLSYATPKRAGKHVLSIEAKDDYTCQFALNDYEQGQITQDGKIAKCTDSVSHQFDANNFDDVTAELSIIGPALTLSEQTEWKAKLRWSRETPVFNWQIESCSGNNTYEVNETGDTVVFNRTEDELGIVKVELTESNTNTSLLSYLVLGNSDKTYYLSQKNIEAACSHL